MKYIITDQGEVSVGNGYHIDLLEGKKGKVVGAGHCEKLSDGWTVYGESIGFRIKAKNSDRKMLEEYFSTKPPTKNSYL